MPLRTSKALAGVVVTSTGLDEDAQADVESVVTSASGIYVPQLTASVTHLVAGAAGSQKHRVASCMREKSKVYIVKPSWIAECRGIKGNTVPDVTHHLLPPLAGFIICATGFQGAARTEIQYLVQRCGATYSKDLSKICTHLVANAPEGKKYAFASGVPSIHIVREQWLRDCHGKKALLHEKNYSFDADTEQQNEEVKPSDESVAGTTARSPSVRGDASSGHQVENVDNSEEHTKNLTNAPANDTPVPSMALETCCIYVVPGRSEPESSLRAMRAKIFRLAAVGGATIAPRWSSAVTHAIIYAVPVASSQVPELRKAESEGIILVDTDWLCQSVASRSLLPPQDYPPPTWNTPESSVLFLDNSSTVIGFDAYSRDGASRLKSFGGGNGNSDHNPQIFQGVRLALGPLAMRDSNLCTGISTKVIAGRGKVLTHDATGRVSNGVPTHVLCPDGLSKGEIAVVESMRAHNPHLELVTTTWIDHCIQDQRLLAVSSCALFCAREYDLPLKEFQDSQVTVAISGFMSKPPDPNRNRRRSLLSKLAVALGAEYSERMRRHCTSHLISESADPSASEKVRRAIEWSIPVVSEHWLVACASMGRLLPVDQYLLVDYNSFRPNGSTGMHHASASRPNSGTSASRPKSARSASDHQNVVKRKTPTASDEHNGAQISGDKLHRTQNACTARDTGSTEDLLKQLAANLERITDVSTAGDGNVAADNSSRNFDDKMPQLSVNASEEPNEPPPKKIRSSENTIPIEQNVFLHSKVDQAQQSDWGLEASQSQMIVHRDLTPPPRSKPPPGHIPKLRIMPSRAAKTRP